MADVIAGAHHWTGSSIVFVKSLYFTQRFIYIKRNFIFFETFIQEEFFSQQSLRRIFLSARLNSEGIKNLFL